MADYRDVNRARWDDSAPWEALPGQMAQLGNGEWRLADNPARLPHTYTLQARKQL